MPRTRVFGPACVAIAIGSLVAAPTALGGAGTADGAPEFVGCVPVLVGCVDVGTFGLLIECTYEDQLIAIAGSAECGGAEALNGLASGDVVSDNSCTLLNPCTGLCSAALCIVEPCGLSPCIPLMRL